MIDFVKAHGLSWLEHTAGALAFQFVAGWLTGGWVWAGVSACAFFAGRECAQIEDKGRSLVLKCADGERRRCHVDTLGSLPLGYGLNPTRWSADGVMDLLMPAAACAIVAGAML